MKNYLCAFVSANQRVGQTKITAIHGQRKLGIGLITVRKGKFRIFSSV